ncbi:MAG: fused MFS/spermidine synthase, partial [Opitutaceae bacterium]|nr:fused MFS/spermidine synthase [Verrucomicrobiales bacterium]
INTGAGALAAPLFGVLLIPVIGSKVSLILIALGYTALIPRFMNHRWTALSVAGISVGLISPTIELRPVLKNARIVTFHEGAMAAVTVVEDSSGHRLLRVNNRFQMGGTAAAAAQYRGAHIPLLLHPAPHRALFLGLGTGITFGAASLHPGLRADGVELLPEVIDVLPAFAPANFMPWTNQNLRIHTADARRFVRSITNRYDVIVADLFHPAMDGAGSLYTREHFTAIRQRLAAGGVFCQWLPLHQLDEPTLQLIVRTVVDVFPEAQAWLLHLNVDAPVLGLIARLDQSASTAQWIEPRVVGPLGVELKKLAMADSVRFVGLLLADTRQLGDLAGPGPLNTDDQPLVLLRAPAFSYRQDVKPYETLERWLQLPPCDYSSLFNRSSADNSLAAQQHERYALARNAYLRGLIADAEGDGSVAVERYLESARLSEDFTLGYAQCLSQVSLLARSRPAEAKSLLGRLIEAQPNRPVAAELLRRLESSR